MVTDVVSVGTTYQKWECALLSPMVTQVRRRTDTGESYAARPRHPE